MPPTAPGKAGNLSLELTSFVGRRREVTEAKQVLSASHLVTLTGVGGIGKSRLALQVAAQVQRAFDDGVWLVELGELQDPALVEHTMAATLGLREQATLEPGEQSRRPPMAMLTEYLAARQVLLVLDNCEHLVDTVAKLVDALLRACPRLRVLATSRERLGVSGEVTLPVPPLPVPDPRRPHTLRGLSQSAAVALFVERAVAVVPGFCLTADNQGAVAQICRRLEGLPLAIELAAARLPALSPAEILHHLSDRFRLLGAGLRGAPARQRTLRACIEWSHGLCTCPERLLWARLTVFVGGFELEAVEGICAGDDLASEGVFDLVRSLVDKSILIRQDGGTVRYRLLDTLREFGQDKGRESGQDTALRRRHRDWYAELVARAEAEWISSRQVDWFARLEREYPNLRAALEFCLTEPGEAGAALRMATSLYVYWFGRGLLSEGRQWLDRALAQQPRSSVERARALYADSMLAGQQSDIAAASALLDEGQEVARQLDDASTCALFSLASGYVAGHRGDLPRSVALLDAALDAFRAENNLPRLLETLFALAVYSGGRGDATRALAAHEEVLAITEPRGEVWYRSISLWALGLAVWQQGQPRRATGLVRESLRLKRPLNDLLGTAWCLEALAWIAAGEPDSRRAATLLGAAQALWHTIGASPATVRHLLGYHEECEQRMRHALGEQAFQAAFQRGMDLSLADAIADALNEKPQAAPAPASAATTLTRREQQVAELVAEGLTNKQIAARLVIAQRTAEGHVERILAKLGFTKRTQLAAWVTEQRQSRER
ncbi:non-specific serine/threonine protein kinase [Kibdelosporangium banguiense]|uniref:Non-specific serine/threonine protein kinase n=1 Tax=Kibdelosporangium banguiense TaxID=1365924 RepID=A0ABS4TVY2_9PSEU|nr:LuxR C-terminal-related transcriptional regulator [Kibdelosporangium banguiense]MBP2328567.1 non-specific serine/threonine protein kinase [Kibdelosporangium banguiense]